jgi:hypothetical protein
MRYLLLLLFLINSLHFIAQTKTFVRNYTYNASEADSKLSSRTIALNEVKTLLLEEIGSYLKSEFENRTVQTQINGQTTFTQLTKSKLVTLVAGITSTKILEEKWNGEVFYIEAEIVVNEADILIKLKELVNDKERTKELEELLAKNIEANETIENLKSELELAKANNRSLSEKDKSRIQENYNENIKVLGATFVGEEIIPGDGVVVIKRKLVKSGTTYTYEKKVFQWGGIACFRDGKPITELEFETETKKQ